MSPCELLGTEKVSKALPAWVIFAVSGYFELESPNLPWIVGPNALD